jgi:hypothetical protein
VTDTTRDAELKDERICIQKKDKTIELKHLALLG